MANRHELYKGAMLFCLHPKQAIAHDHQRVHEHASAPLECDVGGLHFNTGEATVLPERQASYLAGALQGYRADPEVRLAM